MTMPSTEKSLVILGSGSTAARAIALEFAQQGYRLILADFQQEENERIAADVRVRCGGACEALHFDALDYASHSAFLNRCIEKLGGLPTGVLLSFGFMAEQEACQKDFALSQRTIDTNFSGAVSILEVFAAAFEERGGGFIAALSSVAGDRGRQANYIYGAAKSALSTYLSGLRNRLHAAHVNVITIKPGFMDTKMTYGMDLPGPLTASPEKAARDIYRAVEKHKDEIYTMFLWRYIMLIIRNIPEWQFKKMNI